MEMNILNTVKMYSPPGNSFDMSHDFKFTMDMGKLVPILCMDCIPGDKINLASQVLMRMQSMIAPPMQEIYVRTACFFVPTRLVWPNFQAFISGETPAPAPPYMEVDDGVGLWTRQLDYLGIPEPPVGAETERISAIPSASYYLIWHEFFRDQNMIPADTVWQLTDGDNADLTLRSLLKPAWMHDYFTSCLPFAQKGAAVEIPLGTLEDVRVFSNRSAGGTTLTGSPDNQTVAYAATSAPGIPADVLYADTSNINLQSSTINTLRAAFRLQEFLEKDARGGTRYTEVIRAHFGVRSSDARLQRPEFIVGTKSFVRISEVLNTTGTTEAPQGNMAGHGVSWTDGYDGDYFVEEHGYVICLMWVLPTTGYQQGIPRHFLRLTDRYEYPWPEFAQLGEEEVFNREVYAYTPTGGEAFGYLPRYTYAKYMFNRVAGAMRNSLNFWHLGRIFASPPSLNREFIEADPSERIYAVDLDEDDTLICHVAHKLRVFRLLPMYGIPTF